MANKIARIIDSLRNNLTSSEFEAIINVCGEMPAEATQSMQSKYVKKLLDEMWNTVEPAVIRKVMNTCGTCCISNATVDKAKALYKEAANMDEFLKLLNSRHIGGGKLYQKDGLIIGVYEQCYCGLAKNTKGLSADYCFCSEGWFRKLFESVLERQISVKKVTTILAGSEKCIFEIETNG